MKRVLEVFDLDGVLVPESEKLGLDMFVQGAFTRVKPHRPEMGFDETFLNKTTELFFAHGCCIKGWAHELGFDHGWVMESYEVISEGIVEDLKPRLQPDRVIADKLEELSRKPGVKVVGLTQSDRAYCHPLVEHVGLSHVMTREVLHDIRDVNGALKRTEGPFRFIKEKYQGFDEYHMTEDSPWNLPPAKRMGFVTTFVGHKVMPDEVRGSVDYIYPDVYAALEFKLRPV